MTQELTKVYIDLPSHWATSGEALWATPLGDDLYEIDNVPFYAYGINCGDVVRAIAPAADQKPRVEGVVRAGGHRTLRIFFGEDIGTSEQETTLERLRQAGISFERADDRYLAVDISPSANYAHLCSELAEFEARGLLEYETCEIRVPGRFDLDGTSARSDA